MAKVFNPKAMKRARVKIDWSFEILASHLSRRCGNVSYGTVRNWEIGRSIPDANEVQALADVLEVPIDQFYREDKKAGANA